MRGSAVSSLLLALLALSSTAHAHSVGQIDTSVYFDEATFSMLTSRGGGVQLGDEITYIIEFMPVENNATIGAGGYITAYVPPGTEVIGAELVRRNGPQFELTGPSIAGATWTGTGGNDNTYSGYTTTIRRHWPRAPMPDSRSRTATVA